MAKVDRTLQALHEIRDAVKTTNARLDAAIEVLGHRINDSEIRLATEMVAVVRAVDGVRDVLRERLDDRERVEDHERRIAQLERRRA